MHFTKSLGAGAAGGLGGAFLAFFPVTLKPGIEVVMEAIDFKSQIEDADFIITGEGKSDIQTLSGKAPIGIANVAREMGVPVILLSGFIEEESKQQLSTYFYKLASVVGGTISKEESMEKADYYLRIKSERNDAIHSRKRGVTNVVFCDFSGSAFSCIVNSSVQIASIFSAFNKCIFCRYCIWHAFTYSS